MRVSGSRREEYGWTYWSDNDLSSLAVDVECQMPTFLAKTLRLCSGLVVLAYCTLGTEAIVVVTVVTVTGEVSFDNGSKCPLEA